MRKRSNKSRSKFITSPYPLTNFEGQKYYRNRVTFSGVYSRNDLSKINEWTYIINLEEFESIGTHFIALHVNAENVTYFDSFRFEYTPKEIK